MNKSIEVDLTRLQRDYRIEPVKKRCWITYEEMYYLYIELNLSTREVANFCGRTDKWVLTNCRKYNIIKNSELKKKCRERCSLEKWGVPNPMQNDQVKEKQQRTIRTRYKNNPQKALEIVKKRELTCLQHYGVKNPTLDKTIREKQKNTCLKRYGVLYPTLNKDIRKKQVQTLEMKYGTSVPLRNKNCLQKEFKTNFKKYGYKSPSQNEVCKNKSIQKYMQKYGVTNPAKSKEVQKKISETMKINGTYGKSKTEDLIYELLTQKFKVVLRQYECELYPYRCDFYIPEVDLFIEYQGFVAHGMHPYDPMNPEDIEQVALWKVKSKELNHKNQPKNKYLAFIATWTLKDPEKRKCAKDNKLNWLEFFTFKEFKVWYNNL